MSLKKSRLIGLYTLLEQTYGEWRMNQVSMLSAALSFYLLFSLGPLLIILIYTAGLLFKMGVVEDRVVNIIQSLTGVSGVALAEALIQSQIIIEGNIVLNLAGIVILFLAASKVFNHLQHSLNIIWGVKPGKQKLTAILRKRVLSFILILLMSLLLLTSLIAQATLVVFNRYLEGTLPIPPAAINILYMLISFTLMMMLFTSVYKILPDAHITWRDAWTGAVITSTLFVAGQIAISLYLGNTAIKTMYGTAGSVLILLLWIYYSTQVILFGAQFTRVYIQHK